MSQASSSSPSGLFKGIALFTPGGDLIYCIDPQKRNRWHLQLCTALQEQLGLSELPHFLVPCYSATVDRWWDIRTQSLQTSAEACPRVLKYEGLLNAVFGLRGVRWSPSSCSEELCDPELLNNHRDQFPELWEHHNLIAQFKDISILSSGHSGISISQSDRPSRLSRNSQAINSQAINSQAINSQAINSQATDSAALTNQGFVLRLFISGRNASTESTLRKLHHALETSLEEPYTLKVIDVFRNPEQAEVDQITATPTLLKVWPLPNKRIVGNLDNMEQLLSILTLNHR